MSLISSLPICLALWQPAREASSSPSLIGEYFINPFVLAILVFFVFSFFRLLRYLARLPEQHAALSQVTENYREVERKQETNPELIKQDLLRDVNPDSIVAHRVVELQRIGVRGGDFDQVALAEVLAARESAKISIARYIASALVLLGLCGAIWGLSGLIRNMSRPLADVQRELERGAPPATAGAPQVADNTAAMQDSFKRLITTMTDSLASTRGAFYASLTGILASVLLLLANWFASWRQINFLAALEDLTATKLIPIFKPPREVSQLAEVGAAFREGSNYLVGVSVKLDDKVSDIGASLENLLAIVRKFDDAAKALSAHQERVYQAQDQMMGVVNEFVGLTSRIEAHQASTHNDFETVARALDETNKGIERALDDWRLKHEDMMQAIERSARQAHAETKAARELAQRSIDEIAALIRTSVDRQVGTLHEQALGLFKEQQADTRDRMIQMIEQQGSFVAQLQESVAKSDGHQALLSGLAQTISEERSDFARRLEQVLKRNDEALRALLAEQKKIIDVSGLGRVERGLEQFVRENRTEFGSLVERQNELGQHLARLSETAGRLGTLLRVVLGVVAVTVPVFAALGVMFIFDIRPEDNLMRAGSLVVIVAMIFMLAWFLRQKT